MAKEYRVSVTRLSQMLATKGLLGKVQYRLEHVSSNATYISYVVDEYFYRIDAIRVSRKHFQTLEFIKSIQSSFKKIQELQKKSKYLPLYKGRELIVSNIQTLEETKNILNSIEALKKILIG